MKTKDCFRLRPLGDSFILTFEGAASIDFNRLISFNSTTAYLWEKVQGREFTAGDLADMLLERYDVSRETALADASALMVKWKEAGIAE